MNRHPKVELLASEEIFAGRIFRLVSESVRLPSGLRQDLAIVDHPGAVAVAPLFENGELLLVRQYRHSVGDWMLEIPAGRIELGEDPLTSARRELEEETGYCADSWELMQRFFPAPGFCSEVITLFLARGLHPVERDRRAPDTDEELELVRLSLDDARREASRDAKTLLAVLDLQRRALANG